MNGDRAQLLADAATFVARVAVDRDDPHAAVLANRLAAEADDCTAGVPSAVDEVAELLSARR